MGVLMLVFFKLEPSLGLEIGKHFPPYSFFKIWCWGRQWYSSNMRESTKDLIKISPTIFLLILLF